ncbi:MAG: serine--tRNA ligase [Sumerlaeia bacterium]
MHDIKYFRDNPDDTKARLARKKIDASEVDRILALDSRRRELIQETDTLKARRNQLSKDIPALMKSGKKDEAEAIKAESRDVGERMKALDEELRGVDAEQNDLLLRLPNFPHESAPTGGELENAEVRTWGEKRAFDFEPKPHWELGQSLGILDLDRGTKISGSGFFVLKGDGARLERKLINWMLDTHTTQNGYTEVHVPHLVTRQSLTGTGQLPKMEDDMYKMEGEDAFLIPTAEVPVTNLYAGEILEMEQLPIKHVAHTPCYRREAGSYGKENRGISRVHQFDKVEMVQFVAPETSYDVLERLTANATGLLEALGLPYRVLNLASGDMSFAAAKCYDIEVWAPGMGIWLEVSSCSNFEDFQARRAGIRFRREQKAKPEFVHTLNGSGLALPRLVIALLENGQQADGSVLLPPALHRVFGSDRIAAE